MEEKTITEVTPEDFVQLRPLEGALYYKGAFIYNIKDVRRHSFEERNFNHPHRINGFFVLICKQGDVKVNISLNEYLIGENTLLVHLPNSIVQIIQNGELPEEGVILGFDENITRESRFDLKNIIPIILAIKEQPVLSISSEERDTLLSQVENISSKIQDQNMGPYRNDIMRCHFALFFYTLCDIMSKHVTALPQSRNSVKSRNEEYFQRFMQLLTDNYRSERSLGFYASKLCITPKYLTTLIKRVSGRSAAEWIDQYVILEAKNLLRYSTMSIQEVAYYLNFPNQSFFGKYFKHQTGYSPSAYKMLK